MKKHCQKLFAILAAILLIIAAISQLLSMSLFLIDPRVYGTLVWLWQPMIIIECALQIIMAIFIIVEWLPGIMIAAGLYVCSYIAKIFKQMYGVSGIGLISFVRIIIFAYALIAIVVFAALARRKKKMPAFIIALSFSFALVAISIASDTEILFNYFGKVNFQYAFVQYLLRFSYFVLTGIGLAFVSLMLWKVPANTEKKPAPLKL